MRTPQSRYQKGQIILLALVLAGVFFMVSTALISFVASYGRSERASVAATQALAIAEGAPAQAAYQLNQSPSYGGQANTLLGNGTFTIAVSNIDSGTKRITATGFVPNSQNPVAIKIIKANVGLSDSNVSFHYGIQAGEGGFIMDNTSKVVGNVFSGGSVIGSSQNYIYGDVVSSGPNGLVYGIHATSSVYAHTIGKTGETTIVDKDAYYTTKINTTVTGVSYPNSPDQAPVALPISDEQIGEWETLAAAGGTAICESGSYNISSGSVTIGPVKIPCDLNISGSATVTIGGHVWVAGNIIVQNSAIVKMAASLGTQNVAIIADNPSDRLTGSTIKVKNTASFENSG